MLSGFRVPCIIVSPFTRIDQRKQAAVTHNFYDHTSVLKLIEWRWGLQPLTQRDASHAPTDPGNLATALNFSHPVTKVPTLPVLAAFTPTACAATSTTDDGTGGHRARRPRPQELGGHCRQSATHGRSRPTGGHDILGRTGPASPLMDSWSTSSSVRIRRCHSRA